MPVITEFDQHTPDSMRIVTVLPDGKRFDFITPHRRSFDGTIPLFELLVTIAENKTVTPQQVHELFTDQDAPGHPGPAARLNRFVNDLFVKGSPREEWQREFPYFGHSGLLVQSALDLVLSVQHLFGVGLSAEDRGFLVAARAVLRERQVSILKTVQKEWQLWAAQDHLEAANLLEPSGLKTLARHHFWLASALFTDLKRFEEAADAATRALRGQLSTATEGLYFSVAVRCFFHLPTKWQHHVRKAVLDDLALVYCLLPAVEETNAGCTESAPQPEDTVLARLSPEARQKLGYEIEKTGLETQYIGHMRWHKGVLDRLAVLALLCAGDAPPEPMTLWRYEVVRLAKYWPEYSEWSIHDDRQTERFFKFLNTFRDDPSITCPARPYRPGVPLSVQEALNAGLLYTAETACRQELIETTFAVDPLLWQQLWQCLTLCVARRCSTDDALEELETALGIASGYTNTQERAAYASLLTQKAWLLRYSGRTGETDEYYDNARIHAALAGNLEGVAWVNKHAYHLYLHWGRPAEAKRSREWILTLTQYFPAHMAMYIHDSEDPFVLPLKEELPNGWPAVYRDVQRVLERLVVEDDPEMDRVFAANRLLLATKKHPVQMAGMLGKHLDALFLCLRKVPAYKHAIELADRLMRLNSAEVDVKVRAAHHLLDFLHIELRSCHKTFQARRVGKKFVMSLARAAATDCLHDSKQALEWIVNSKTNVWSEGDDADDAGTQAVTQAGYHDAIPARHDALSDRQEEAEVPQVSVTAGQIQSALKGAGTCVLEFIVGTNGSAIFCISEDGIQRISIPASGSKLNQLRNRLWNLAKDTGRQELGGNPLEAMHLHLGDTAAGHVSKEEQAFDQKIYGAAWEIWQEYGRLVLTPEVQAALRPFQHVYLAPHFSLLGLPLHLLPIETGELLIENKAVLYLPSAGHLVRAIERQKSEAFVSINRNVFTNIATSAPLVSALQKSGWKNEWPGSGLVNERLRRMAEAQTVVLVGHGMYDGKDPRNTRFGFDDGMRLRVRDIEEAEYSFEGTEVYMTSCSSGRVRHDRTFARSSFTRAFLDHGAAAVLSCLWVVNMETATEFTASMLMGRSADLSRGAAYQNAVLQLIKTADHPMKKVVLAGPFILYGIN